MRTENKIIFLPKDPHWTFIWWELSQEAINRLEKQVKQEITETKLNLRIYDITDIYFNGNNSHYYFDVEVKGNINHYYLNIWASNRTYCVEIGFMKERYFFYPIARSNLLSLPQDCSYSDSNERWSTIDMGF